LVCLDAAAEDDVHSLDGMVAHMRFLLGMIFGALLIVAAVFIADSLAAVDASGAAPRHIVNWDVAGDRLHEFNEAVRGGWNKR
jgi:hypothetical protein